MAGEFTFSLVWPLASYCQRTKGSIVCDNKMSKMTDRKSSCFDTCTQSTVTKPPCAPAHVNNAVAITGTATSNTFTTSSEGVIVSATTTAFSAAVVGSTATIDGVTLTGFQAVTMSTEARKTGSSESATKPGVMALSIGETSELWTKAEHEVGEGVEWVKSLIETGDWAWGESN